MDFGRFLQLFGKNLRKARWLAGLTQQEVAAQGISYRWYAELERGQRNPTVRMVFELAQILGVSPTDLLDVPGARPAKVRLVDRVATAPKRGRRPARS